MPLLRPVIANGALTFLRVQTFTTTIYEEFDLEFNSASGVALSAVLLLFCLQLVAESRMRGGTRRYARIGAGARRAAPPVSLGGWALPAAGILIVLIAAGVGMPLGMLVYRLAVGHSQAVTSDLIDATRTTLCLSVLGAMATTVLGIALALGAHQNRTVLSRIAARLPFFIHALPGLVIALALVFFSLHYVHVLYQTTFLLMVGYVTLYVPLVQVSVHGPLEQRPGHLEDVARSLGQSPLSVFARVTLPNISARIGAGAALVFLQIMKELTATLILLLTGIDTLPIEVWQHARDMEYAGAAPFAALLMLVSGTPVYFLMRYLQDALNTQETL